MTAPAPLTAALGDRRAQGAALVLGSLVVGSAVLVGSTVLAGSAFPASAWFAASGLVPLLWIAAAAGYGRVLRRMLFPRLAANDPRRIPLALGLGIAFALVLINLLATYGLLPAHTWSRAVWWVGMMIGWVLAGLSWSFVGSLVRVRRLAVDPLLWCALPALAALAVVTALPPGLAWSTEFGGYDALAYHLELPKEWLAAGALQPLRHNVYSAFPSFVEGAYLQLFSLVPSNANPAHTAALAPQMLHALLAVCAAWMVATTAETIASGTQRRRSWTRAIGWCGFLGIPWVIVTGSLAYNEMAVLLMLAAAMLVWTARDHSGPCRTGIALGLLLGAAVGAKLVATGMVVVPFACWALLTMRSTHEPSTGISLSETPTVTTSAQRTTSPLLFVTVSAMVTALTALLVLAPWLLRNHAATGSWTFPFAVPFLAGADGNVWWDTEQMTRFAAGHAAAPGTSISTRFSALRDAAFLYGFDTAPINEPWLPQWSIAFWIGSAAIVVLLIRMRRQGIALGAMLVAQLAFWMFATHMKSRFLLPCAVPLTVAVAVAAAPVFAHHARRIIGGVGVLLLTAWCLQPALLIRIDARTERHVELCAAIGAEAIDLGPGTAAAAQESAALGEAMPLAWIANWQLPPGSVLGSEGDADVFWCHTAPITGTVWDGGPLVRVLRAHPNDPVAAVRALGTDEHLTHLAIGESMLARWKASGWLDPILTPDRVRAVAALMSPVQRTTSGGTVYKVPLAESGTRRLHE